MLMSLSELERLAYINGRTFLARAYAAADDNAQLAEKLGEVVSTDLDKLSVSMLPQFVGNLEAASEHLEDNPPQLTLNI